MAIEDLYIDPVTGDLAMDASGNILWCEGAVRVGQQARARLDMQRGSWFRDLRVGVRWREKIFAKGATDVEIAAEITRELLAVPDIARVDDITITREPGSGGDLLSISFTAVTSSGVSIGETITA